MHTVYNMHKINQEILRYKTDQSLNQRRVCNTVGETIVNVQHVFVTS